MRNFLLLCLSITFFANAEITPQGTGELFGDQHRFRVTASQGWVLDTENGISNGIHMLFYPENIIWSESPAIIYGRYAPIAKYPTVESQVERVLKQFHSKGSPDYQAIKQPPITLDNGNTAELYFFTGDQWGNYEAAVYFKESTSINFLILSTHSKSNFDKYLPDFLTTAKSYQNKHDDGTLKVKFEELKDQAKKTLKQDGAKSYELKITKIILQLLPEATKKCSMEEEPTEKTFDYLLTITNDGKISESFIYPQNAFNVCLVDELENINMPSHQLDGYIFHMNLTITP